MSDNSLTTTAPMDDIELITRFLNHQLDDATAEQVRARLENDPEFYNLAEPLLFAWSVPRHVDRHPRPEGELEEMWDRFTRRHRFVHQRQKARRRWLWILGFVAVALVIMTFVKRDDMIRAFRDYRDFEAVAADTGWVTLRDGNQVLLAPGARLSSSKRLSSGAHRVRLEGRARFRVLPGAPTPEATGMVARIRGVPGDTTGIVQMMAPLSVETRGGIAFSGFGEFTVTAHGDTTDVEVHHPTRRRFFGFVPLPTNVFVSTKGQPEPLSLGETQAARVIRGGRAERTRR